MFLLGAGSVGLRMLKGPVERTHGHDMIETRAMPIMMAPLTLKAMRKVVSRPPHMIPTHI